MQIKLTPHVIALLLMSFWVQLSHADLTVTLDRSIVTMNDIVVLTIRTETPDGGAGPNIKIIEKDFEILNRSSKSETSIRNGKARQSQSWVYQVLPKRVGKITIPSLSYQQQRSEPVTLEVLSTSSANKTYQTGSGADPVELNVSLDKTTAYIEEQLVLTMEIVFKTSVNDAGLSELEIPDMIIEQLGEQKVFNRRVGDRTEQVIEQKFALYPLATGQLSIPPVILEAVIPDPNRRQTRRRSPLDDFMNPFGQRGAQKKIRQQSERLSLFIKAIPDSYPKDARWIPASDVSWTQQWRPESPTFQVGDPVTRLLSLEVVGQHQKILPKLPPRDTPDLKIYSDKSEHTQRSTPTGLIAQRSDSQAIIPMRSGRIVLPEEKMYWWNTQKDRLESIVLPAYEFDAAAAAGSAGAAQPAIAQTQPSLAETAPQQSPINQTIPTTDGSDIDAIRANNSIVAIQILVLICLALSTCLNVWFWMQNHNRKIKQQTNKQPHQDKALTLKAAHKKIIEACNQQHAKATKQALVSWANLKFPDLKIVSLLQLKPLCQKSGFSTELDHLQAKLYTSNPSDWDSRAFKDAFIKWEATLTQKMGAKASNGELAPLYR